MNLHTPRSYQSSLNKSTEKMTKRQDKATIGLGSYKNYKVYYRSQGQEPGPSLHDRRCVGETAHCPGGDCPSLLVWSPFACFGHFSFFCLFVYRCSPMNFGEVSSWNHCWWLVVNPNLQGINKKETRLLHHDDDDDVDDDMNRKDAPTLNPVGHQSTNWMLFCTLIAAMAAFTSYVNMLKIEANVIAFAK